jgi:hypothetical protein
MQKTIFINNTINGVPTNAYSVTLNNINNSYGIQTETGTVVVPAGTQTNNPSVGAYEYPFNYTPGVIYEASWEIIQNQGDVPSYYTQIFGPFPQPSTTPDTQGSIRSVPEYRGSFAQASYASLFLRINALAGSPVDPESITATIQDQSLNAIHTASPEKLAIGLYVFEWYIPGTQPVGEYIVTWSYTVQGVPYTNVQTFVISNQAATQGLYNALMIYIRQGFTNMIQNIQAIPVYRELAKPSVDKKTYYFSFNKWNQSPGCKLYRNNLEVDSGYMVDYANGKIVFDTANTDYDTITADYNFKWFSDDQLDTFLNNASQMFNIAPPQTLYSLLQMPGQYISVVLYGATVDALRNMMLSLQFQEPQMVFGGPEKAQTVFGNLETLKKNYEETWNKALDNKRLGSYKGLTQSLIIPSFALPGSRSRWFRMMFSTANGS